MIINLKPTVKLLLPALLLTVVANAQKLPSKQQISLRAPANIKIDGKATEWDNKFQAYNNATDVFYTIANNNAVLYLTIRASERKIVDKILRGGITLTINHTENKTDKEAVAVTYPVVRDDAASSLLNVFSGKSNEYREANKNPINVDDLNKELDARSKLINVKGIKTITDESISVYNEENIKAASKFDGDLGYTYELAVPLKYLALPDNGANKFSYNIKVNEPAAIKPTTVSVMEVVVTGRPAPPMANTSMAPTDFWGEYTLAK